MKHFFLITAVAFGTWGAAYGQAKFPLPVRKAPRPQPVAAQPLPPEAQAAAPVRRPPAPRPTATAATDGEAPKYGGFYINGTQASEINCYGADEFTLVYPFFSALDGANSFSVEVYAGSYDKKGKFHREYTDLAMYEETDADVVQSKFAGKGYGIITRSNLLALFNQNRGVRPGQGYTVNSSRPAFNILKYTTMDSTKIDRSVIGFTIYMMRFTGYDAELKKQYSESLVYNSPEIKLVNRLNTARPSLKNRQLPVMQSENCTPTGRAISLLQVKKVPRNGIGEEPSVD